MKPQRTMITQPFLLPAIEVLSQQQKNTVPEGTALKHFFQPEIEVSNLLKLNNQAGAL